MMSMAPCVHPRMSSRLCGREMHISTMGVYIVGRSMQLSCSATEIASTRASVDLLALYFS